jgi:hypothetical protein
MSWSSIITILSAIWALSIFLDRFHFHKSGERWIVDFLRSILVNIFLKLDQVENIQIARRIMKVPYWVIIPYSFLVALLCFMAGAMIFGIIAYFGKAEFPGDFLFYYVAIGAFLYNTFLLVGFRLISKYAKDWICIVTLIFSVPAQLWLAISPGDFFFSAGNEGPLIFTVIGIILLILGILGSFPSLILSLSFITVLMLKYASLLVKVVGMKVTDGASSPKTTPFSYFAALSSVITLLFAAIFKFIN